MLAGRAALKYGVTKQYALGLETVLASGEVLRSGGRCHKNSTGFDLTSLMVGSEGMLGIITEITVRLIPHPQARAMLGASFADFAAAAGAVQAILDSGTLPSALEITDGFTMAAARDYLGSDKLPPGDAYLMVEIDGNDETVSRELARLHAVPLRAGALRIDEAPTRMPASASGNCAVISPTHSNTPALPNSTRILWCHAPSSLTLSTSLPNYSKTRAFPLPALDTLVMATSTPTSWSITTPTQNQKESRHGTRPAVHLGHRKWRRHQR